MKPVSVLPSARPGRLDDGVLVAGDCYDRSAVTDGQAGARRKAMRLAKKARDIMVRSELSLSAETSITEATTLLLKRQLVAAPVVDPDNKLVGVLTDVDCLSAAAGEAFDGVPQGMVQDYMTREVDTIGPDASLYDIIGKFRQTTHRKFPVVDDQGRVVGQLSRRDALRAIESVRDNSYLYGSKDESPADVQGVDSAMRLARDRRSRSDS